MIDFTVAMAGRKGKTQSHHHAGASATRDASVGMEFTPIPGTVTRRE
ncbi:hypothetical protein CSC18_3065 [Klebsiella aerogenes]|nr:hypothetical protein CSC18_3065 [Klebsiella aerogenes]